MYLDLAGKLKNTQEYIAVGETNCHWRALYNLQRISTGNGVLRNKRTNGYHPKYIIVEIGQNTKKTPGGLRRLAMTQTPVEKLSKYVKKNEFW